MGCFIWKAKVKSSILFISGDFVVVGVLNNGAKLFCKIFNTFNVINNWKFWTCFFYDFIIQNLLVVQRNVLLQNYAKNIEFW